jgi:hypothetical protein
MKWEPWVKCQMVKSGVKSYKCFPSQEANLLQIVLLISICTIALWNKNVKTTFQGRKQRANRPIFCGSFGPLKGESILPNVTPK